MRVPRSRMIVTGIVLILSGAMMAAWAAESTGGSTDEWKAPARAARKKNPIPADEKSIAAGKVFYEHECLACHGKTGKGDGPTAKDLEKSPGDLTSPKLAKESDGALFWKITEGRKPMPSFDKKFSDDERWEIVNYIRTFAPRPAETK